ncbi:hypothetical protein GCM10022224_090950 [Nonomuraea antimicrobica]|uniref:DUF222 domain-containing protein n=1 Tax=Nonomuraea antimicrobica TaxID=561173 RepID=A0ABP7DZ12_9ACTN
MADYVRSYPDVDAPHPDGVPLWPEQVDQALAALRARCLQLRGYLTEANAGLEHLAALPGLVPALEVPFTKKGQPAPPPSVKASVARRDRAAQACRRAIDKAAARFTTALEQAAAAYSEALTVHRAEVEEPYRDACVHYVLAAAAAVQAAADGRDPIGAVKTADPAAITVWPWLPEAPVTGLADVDASLDAARLRAGGRPAKRRRRTVPVQAPDLLREGSQITGYGDALADLVSQGRLSRLLLRRRS